MTEFSGKRSDESTTSTSLSLLERMKDRDEEAWGRFATLYGRIVIPLCRRAGLQPADQADVFQEVTCAVARHLDDFRHGGRFRAWLRSIARNKILDHFRRQQRQPVGLGGSTELRRIHELPDGLEQGEESPDEADLDIGENAVLAHEALRLVRDEFKDRTWEAFWRTVVDGISAVVVADELGMTRSAVRVAKSRVLRRVRDELGDLME